MLSLKTVSSDSSLDPRVFSTGCACNKYSINTCSVNKCGWHDGEDFLYALTSSKASNLSGLTSRQDLESWEAEGVWLQPSSTGLS